jgi:hypothetical protein
LFALTKNRFDCATAVWIVNAGSALLYSSILE